MTAGMHQIMDNEKIDKLSDTMTEARKHGALFHVTNPADAWFCTNCSVFGRDIPVCWSCGTKDVRMQWVPRFGGGSQSYNACEEVVTQQEIQDPLLVSNGGISIL